MNYFNITLIGGEPCSGKSTLVKKIIQEEKINKYFEYDKILKGYYNKDYVVLGLYEDSTFPGTDRLSMAVQPKFIKYLEDLPNNFRQHIIFEGDRLFKTSMIEYLSSFSKNFRLVILQCSENTKKNRHISRKDNQSQAWLKSKKTTVDNVKSKYIHHLLTSEDINFKQNYDYIVKLKKEKITYVEQQTLF
jgi:hypothetical protein